jgi:hypothetical protein
MINTELQLIVAAQIIGKSNIPKTVYSASFLSRNLIQTDAF